VARTDQFDIHTTYRLARNDHDMSSTMARVIEKCWIINTSRASTGMAGNTNLVGGYIELIADDPALRYITHLLFSSSRWIDESIAHDPFVCVEGLEMRWIDVGRDSEIMDSEHRAAAAVIYNTGNYR
jgi:hypothetical protein